jgi:hypothetical protein
MPLNQESAIVRSTTILILASMPFAFLVGCRQRAVPANTNSRGVNLKIVASHLGSESLWLLWKVTITGDGTVVKEVFDEHDGQWRKTETKLSQEDLAEIMAKVKEAEFDILRNSYISGGSDISRLTVAITENKKTKQVSIGDPSSPGTHNDVKRFLRVWSEILRKVPSPNADEKPELYEPGPSIPGRPASDEQAK